MWLTCDACHLQFFSPLLSLHLIFDNAVIFVLSSIAFALHGPKQQAMLEATSNVNQSIPCVTFECLPILLQSQKWSRPCWRTTLTEKHSQPLLLLNPWWINLSGGGGRRWMAAFLNCLPLITAWRHHLKWQQQDKMSWRNEIAQKLGCALIWAGIPGHLPWWREFFTLRRHDLSMWAKHCCLPVETIS